MPPDDTQVLLSVRFKIFKYVLVFEVLVLAVALVDVPTIGFAPTKTVYAAAPLKILVTLLLVL